MAVLVIAEHDNSNLKSSTLNTITAAKKLSDDIHLIILGSNIEELANKSKVVHLLSKAVSYTHLTLPTKA